MKILKYFFIFNILVFLISCGSSSNKDILQYTTDKTLGLTRVNLEAIADKIPVEKIISEKKDLKPDDKTLLQLISKPKESGLDIDKPLYIMVDEGKGERYPDTKMLFWITDVDKFQKNMTKLSKEKVTIDKKNFIYSNNKLIGNLKDDMAIITMKDSYKTTPYYYNQDSLSTGSQYYTKTSEKYFEDFWKRQGTRNSKIKDQVNDALVNDKDVSGWINLAALANYFSKGYIETLAVNKLIMDSGIGFDFTFDKGKVEVDMKSFFNDDLKKVIEKHYDENKINYDLVKDIELNNSKSFSIGFFSLELVKYLIKEAGFEATVNKMLEYQGVTLNDVNTIFTGHYAVINFKDKKSDSLYNNNVATVFGINKKNINKLQMLMHTSYMEGKKFQIVDDKIIFTEDIDVMTKFKNKQSGKNDLLEKKSDITSYSWSNGEELNEKNNKAKAKVTSIVNESKEEGGNIISKIEINLNKKDENALYYFISNE